MERRGCLGEVTVWGCPQDFRSECWGQQRGIGSLRSPQVSDLENRWDGAASQGMKSAGRAAIVERGEGTCWSHVQHGLGAIGIFCGLGKSRKSSE